MASYDLIVIGAGPAGYVAAIRAAQLGLKTACIDSWLNEEGKPSLGGTCLNVGCIPSKALLESSALYETTVRESASHGIALKGVSLDLATMMARKQGIVTELTAGIAALFKANGVVAIAGVAKVFAGRRVVVTPHDPGETFELSARHLILAPGSRPRVHPVIPVDGKQVVDSSGALAFEKPPKRLAVIGAGVIALELGSVWRRLGAKVELIQYGSEFLPDVDSQIGRMALQQFKGQGINVHFNTEVVASASSDRKIELTVRGQDGDRQERYDKVIVAIGRESNSSSLLGDGSGVEIDAGGMIVVDGQCRTGTEGVYAIGDAVRGPMLAHKGSEEGIMVAELIAGHAATVNYQTIPLVIYTDPEIAWCGASEQALKKAGIDFNSGSFPFAANGRAKASGHTAGMVKVIADAKSDRILGVHIVGPHASELIAQAVIAMEFGASSEDLALTVFAHPSLSEVVHEAALDVLGNAIHKARSKRR